MKTTERQEVLKMFFYDFRMPNGDAKSASIQGEYEMPNRRVKYIVKYHGQKLGTASTIPDSERMIFNRLKADLQNLVKDSEKAQATPDFLGNDSKNIRKYLRKI